ncbi:MAG: hypothetical protein F4216_13085, partial [Acidimicrobiaceae bacterium]|nr:hypothetical protein [Acidimicrobiaceae bacterium]
MRSASRRAVRGGLAVALAAGLLAAAPPSSPLSPARAAAQTDGGDSGAPSVVKMEITSDPGADLTYGLGDEIEVEVTFSEKVMVDTAGGVPRLLIDFSTEGWGHKWAGYASGSGTSVLAFTHTVVVPNYSSQGVAVPANGLEANGGSITSVASGTAAVLSYSGLEHNPDHLVDAALTDNAAPPDDAPPPDDAALSDARVPRQTPGPTITISGGSAVNEGSAA